jgi:hypothetical protein
MRQSDVEEAVMVRSISLVLAVGTACLLPLGPLHAGECALESPAHRVPVLELYTSEGCNSCPPADRWFSGLRRTGIGPESAVLLAFHVDYRAERAHQRTRGSPRTRMACIPTYALARTPASA